MCLSKKVYHALTDNNPNPIQPTGLKAPAPTREAIGSLCYCYCNNYFLSVSSIGAEICENRMEFGLITG